MATRVTTGSVPHQTAEIPHPSFAEMTRAFLHIGLLSFGGPAGQIALMHKVLVEEKRWISEPRFLHALNYCMLLPGPEAQQLATYIGWLLHGVRGGVTAGLLFIIPGFFVILALSIAYALFQGTAVLGAVFFGLKAAVLAVVIEALLRVAKRALKNNAMWGIAAASFVGIFVFDVPFPLIILAAGLIGYAGYELAPEVFASTGHARTGAPEGPYLQLQEPTAERGWRPTLKVVSLWGAIWAAPVGLAALALGPKTVMLSISAFFSKMAVVTFGGAYAVLAYVAQQAVEKYGWLQPGEMMDGLAMAETTPGPLILVLTYVGFLASYRAPGVLSPMTSGILGATLTTWVTFAPCFLFIFAGAPYVERLRSNKALSGALTAITAAVVGVILNLTVWFALHVMFAKVGSIEAWPISMKWPVFGTIDVPSTVLALAAAVALFRFKIGMIPVLAGCAAAGLVWKLGVGIE
jgi:chromate transporter